MSLLEKIKDKTREDFKNNFRWDGVTPYFTHLEAVSENAALLLKKDGCVDTQELIIRIIGLLHDEIEDIEKYKNNEDKLIQDILTLDTKKELELHHWNYISMSLYDLNKNNYDSYLDFVLGCKSNRYSRIVKIADINHNLTNLKGKKRDKYLLARHILEN